MKAFVTLITSDNFLPGVLNLNKTFMATSPTYPLYVFIAGKGLSKNSLKELERNNIKYIVDTTPSVCSDINLLNSKEQERWQSTFEKLKIFRLTQFEKIVFVDADMYIVNNIDSLFDKPSFSAVRSRSNVFGKDYFSFNSGLMVVEPSLSFYEEIRKFIVPTVKDSVENNYACGDQNVLNNFYHDWHLYPKLHLPDGYNIFWSSINSYIIDGYKSGKSEKQIFIIHFTGKHKPWMRKKWFCVKSVIRPLYHGSITRFQLIKLLYNYYK